MIINNINSNNIFKTEVSVNYGLTTPVVGSSVWKWGYYSMFSLPLNAIPKKVVMIAIQTGVHGGTVGAAIIEGNNVTIFAPASSGYSTGEVRTLTGDVLFLGAGTGNLACYIKNNISLTGSSNNWKYLCYCEM